MALTDESGAPVDGARVSLDAQPVGTTSNRGRLVVQGLTSGVRTLDLEAALHEPLRDEVSLDEEVVRRAYVLGWGPGVVRASVVRGGEPVDDAVVRFFGSRRTPPRPVDGSGRSVVQLAPGRWSVLATSPSAGVGEATVTVPEGSGLTPVTVEVAPAASGQTDLVVRITDPLGRPVEGARVRIDDGAERPARDGILLVRALPRRTVEVSVTAEGFASVAPVPVDLDAEQVEHLVELPFVRVPLDVRTVAADGTPIASARVRVEGPLAEIELLETDADGRASVRVPPGRWTVIAARDDLSVAQSVDIGLDGIPEPLALVLARGSARREATGVEIAERIAFDFDRATLRPESRDVLEAVARVIRSDPSILKVEVQGHTDDLGTAEVNQRLSDRRAQVVVAELVGLGVAPEKLISRGYGRRRPRADNATREGRAANRRVQFVIVEQSEPGPEGP